MICRSSPRGCTQATKQYPMTPRLICLELPPPACSASVACHSSRSNAGTDNHVSNFTKMSLCVCWLRSESKMTPGGGGGGHSIVGIATCHGLDGPGIESRWGRASPHLCRPAPGPTQPRIEWVQGVKRSGRGVNHPPPSSAEVKERVELYIRSPSGLSWPVLIRNFSPRTLIELLRWDPKVVTKRR